MRVPLHLCSKLSPMSVLAQTPSERQLHLFKFHHKMYGHCLTQDSNLVLSTHLQPELNAYTLTHLFLHVFKPVQITTIQHPYTPLLFHDPWESLSSGLRGGELY